MKYWMSFRNNDNVEDMNLSTINFTGENLSIPKLKERFNTNFVKNTSIKTVKISFLGNGINKSFIAGSRKGKIVICDTDTKKEYTPREFSIELNLIELILNPQPKIKEIV